MDFKNKKDGDKLVVSVSGRLDAITAQEFDAQCREWLATGDVNVIADLSGLEYISSAGLRSILSAAKQLKGAKGSLTFCNLSGMVEEVFVVSGFAAMFTLHPTLEDALAS
ncbi:MAG: STAS domain-containing protein [Pseudodesulfovibrio sp.]|uniref:Anti-sigma factor antagonist n=1 Tax=Pseudodesulfovibrio aespoeensis (strain ATCC 700646 / DSM 10631 / Aspo-2) TaxID=643562 RepID=E6VYT4_PSEA9|nr:MULTISPECIES: STAS domain-containing protein [Pseudodesulfovibrio]MBU4192703.1 STAS domain-containing protein [Pseudomonadota bacterium]ADU63951.1 anti-anti-sigma factor [Pseudodesulfovibrio aespoeensis Aspo-2]MBU4244168.1 STAS domain-containing protein [Pseudomonadota bacterium]MBU4379277.1 STAS domain-containing protein [Pseudomonadota bacterium]MBU4474379.1 STAS domain-containing protein [Pseudomonadota bacterium]